MTVARPAPAQGCAPADGGRCRHLAEITLLARDLASAQDRTAVLDALCGRIRRCLDTPTAYVAVNRARAAEAVVCSSQGVVTPPFRRLRLPHRIGLGGVVAADGVPRATEDYACDPALAHAAALDLRVREEGLRGIAAAPVPVGARVVGVAMAGVRHRRRFDPHEIAVLEALSAVAGAAIGHHAGLHAAEQRARDAVGSVEHLREVVRHQQELLARGSCDARAAERLVGDLLAGRVDDRTYRVRTTALGLDPGREYTVHAIAPTGNAPVPDVSVVADGLVAVADLPGAPLVLALVPTTARVPGPRDLAVRLGAGETPTVGVAGPARRAADLHVALRDAVRTVRVLRGLGRDGVVAEAGRLGPLGRLAAGGEPGELRTVLDHALEPLAGVDPDRRDRLLATLAAWFDHDGSVKRTARALRVHVNTVYGRLDRLDELFGPGWRSGPRRLELETAVRLQLLGQDLERDGQEGVGSISTSARPTIRPSPSRR